MACMFNKYFEVASNSNTGVSSAVPDIDEYKNMYLSNILFTESDVLKVLSSLDCSKACGPDGVSPAILKHCAKDLAPSLVTLFNLSMEQSKVPTSWKSANVIPVHNKGDRYPVSNYRAISLLSIVSKVMEKCIHNHVNIITNNLICSEQHGFIKGKSCSTQLTGVYHEIGSHLDSSIQTDIIYFDFSKAFDSVSHRLLHYKFIIYGFNGRLVDWFTSYLSDRKQRVVVEGVESSWLNVLSGIPQGSILGPKLFLLFINDMPKVVSSSKLSLFADDAKCYRKFLSHNDCQLLQNDINNLYDYGIRWRLKFSFEKCTMLSVTWKKILLILLILSTIDQSAKCNL